MLILDILLAFAVALTVNLYLAGFHCAPRILDHPNARSLHGHPVPRTGGIAVLAGIATGVLPTELNSVNRSDQGWIYPLIGLSLLAMISFLDDRRGVAARWRILIHIVAAGSLLAAGFAPARLDLPGCSWPLPDGIALLLSLLFTVWMINLYNFMDGMDGFAGGMAVIGFTTLAWLGRADAGFTVVCLAVAAASAGFLIHNFPPAKIFLGDTGATTLGFLAAACILWGNQSGLFPLWAAVLTFSPFIVDATVTLLRRLARDEKVWEAHRTHYYQRLVLLGWGHRRVVLAEYALMLACAGSAAQAARWPPVGQAVLAMAWIVIYGFLLWGVGWLERRHVTVSAP